MMVPRTADTHKVEADDQYWSHSASTILDELTNVITPTFLQQWDKFSNEFIQTTSHYCTEPQMTSTSDTNVIIDKGAI